MTRGHLWRTGLAIVLALTGFSAHGLYAQECADVSGAWDVAINLPDGSVQDVKLTMEQDGCEVTGLIEGNNRSQIENGLVEGSTFTFNVTVDGGGQQVTLSWEGTMDGDAVSGTWGADAVGTMEFSGTRAEG